MHKLVTVVMIILICCCRSIGQVDEQSVQRAFRELDTLHFKTERRITFNDSIIVAYGMGEIQQSLPNSENVAEMDALLDGLTNLFVVSDNIDFQGSALQLTKSEVHNIFNNGLECSIYVMFSIVAEEGKAQNDFYQRIIELTLPNPLEGEHSLVSFLQATNSKFYEYKTYTAALCTNDVLQQFITLLKQNGITIEEKTIDQSQNAVSLKMQISTNAYVVKK